MLALKIYRLVGRLGEPLVARRVSPPRRGMLPQAEIWFHAASVGEAAVAAAIIKALRQKGIRPSILLTLQTETGLKKAKELLGEICLISLAPLDFPGFAEKALEQVKPQILALIETELWPNLILSAQRKGVKLLLLNGRLSLKAFKRYLLVRGLLTRLLESFSALGVIGPIEAERFLRLGAPRERLSLLGNAKYDLLFERAQRVKVEGIKEALGKPHFLITFGSLRSGEEKEAAKASKTLLKEFAKLKIALVPRHLTLVKKLARELDRQGVAYGKWSENPKEGRLIIVDKIGPLLSFYGASHVAFVGGSLVPKGGQNPLEPAIFGIPTFFGPHMENFPYEAGALISALGNETTVRTGNELAERISRLLKNEEERIEKGAAARKVVEKFLGASPKYAALVEKHLTPLRP